MNLSDLTEELHHRADEANSGIGAPGSAGAGGPGAVGRVIAVRHRIQVRRRRRLAAAGAVVACAVAAAFAVPSVDFARDNTLPADGGTISPFASHDGGDPLIASVVGKPGETALALTFTPRDLDLTITPLCSDPGTPEGSTAEDQSTRWFAVETLTWDRGFGGSCHRDAVPSTSINFGDQAATNRAGWASIGLVAGRENTIIVQLKEGDQPPAGLLGPEEQVRLGLAIYERSGARVTVGDARLREVITFGGHDYKLAEHRWAGVAGDGATLELDTPASKMPVVIVAGAEAHVADAESHVGTATVTAGGYTLSMDGVPMDGSEGWGTSIQDLDDTEAHRIELDVTGDSEGTAVLAYYTLEE